MFLCFLLQLINPQVLDGNKEAADILAALVHRDVTFSPDPDLMERVPDLPVEHLGIWIDPVGEVTLVRFYQYSCWL